MRSTLGEPNAKHSISAKRLRDVGEPTPHPNPILMPWAEFRAYTSHLLPNINPPYSPDQLVLLGYPIAGGKVPCPMASRRGRWDGQSYT